MTPEELRNITYVRVALAYDATYLHASTPVAPGVTLVSALAKPERVVLPVWNAAIATMRIPYDGPVDFDALARFVNSNMKSGGVEASNMASIGLRALRAATRRENSK